MIILHEGTKALLFIEPRLPPSYYPVIDKALFKLTGALRQSMRAGNRFGSVFEERPGVVQWIEGGQTFGCVSCGPCYDGGLRVNSEGQDYELHGGYYVNSLCLHYLAFHREEIPQDQIKVIRLLKAPWAVPTTAELLGRFGGRYH